MQLLKYTHVKGACRAAGIIHWGQDSKALVFVTPRLFAPKWRLTSRTEGGESLHC
jgi:hypothetical protein